MSFCNKDNEGFWLKCTIRKKRFGPLFQMEILLLEFCFYLTLEPNLIQLLLHSAYFWRYDYVCAFKELKHPTNKYWDRSRFLYVGLSLLSVVLFSFSLRGKFMAGQSIQRSRGSAVIAMGSASEIREPGGTENVTEPYLCESPGALESAPTELKRLGSNEPRDNWLMGRTWQIKLTGCQPQWVQTKGLNFYLF